MVLHPLQDGGQNLDPPIKVCDGISLTRRVQYYSLQQLNRFHEVAWLLQGIFNNSFHIVRKFAPLEREFMSYVMNT